MANIYSMSLCTFKWTTKIVFPPSGSNSTQQWNLLSSCGAKYTHRDFGLLLLRNLSEEAGKSQDNHTPQFGWKNKCGRNKCCVSRLKRAAITNTGQQNHPPNCAAICVHFMARERALYKCARYVVGLCVWCLVLWYTTPE